MIQFFSRFKSFFLGLALRLRGFWANPERRRRFFLFAIGAITLLGAVFLFVGVENLLRIFRPQAAVTENLNWSSVTSMSDKRSEGALVEVTLGQDKYLYALGGLVEGSDESGNKILRPQKTVERLKLGADGAPTGSWESVAEMLSPRAGLRAVQIGQYLYAVAGDFHLPPGGEFGPYIFSGPNQITRDNLLTDLVGAGVYDNSQWEQLISDGLVWFSAVKMTGDSWESLGYLEYPTGFGGWKNLRDDWNDYSLDDKSKLAVLVKLSLLTEGELGYPLPYSTVERLDLQTGRWEPVARLLDLNYYPEIIVKDNELQVVGGVYGDIFNVQPTAAYSFSWGDSSQTTGGTGGTGGTGAGVETEPGRSGGGLSFRWLGQPQRALAAELKSLDDELGTWFKFGGSNGQIVGVSGSSLYLPNPQRSIWSGSTWGRGQLFGPVYLRWREIDLGDGKKLRFFFFFSISENSNAGMPLLPPADPRLTYAASLIQGHFFTTTSVHYRLKLDNNQWFASELPESTDYAKSPGYDTDLAQWEEDNRFKKFGAIRFQYRESPWDLLSSQGGQVVALAQGRYGHRLAQLNNQLYLFGGASVGSAFLVPNWQGYGTIPQIYSPFWVIEDGDHLISIPDGLDVSRSYTYRTFPSLKWTNETWSSAPFFNQVESRAFSGRAFHTIVELKNDEQASLLLVAGGLANEYYLSNRLVVSPTNQAESFDGQSWSRKAALPKPVYSLTAMAAGNRAVFAGGAASFPPSFDVYTTFDLVPHRKAQAASGTYLWDGEGFSPLPSVMSPHADLLDYAWAVVQTEDAYNKHFSLYLAGGGSWSDGESGVPPALTASKAVSRFGPLLEKIPAKLSFATSTIGVYPDTIQADGQDRATVTVTLRDSREDPITTGGYEVKVSSSLPPYVTSSAYDRKNFYSTTVDIISPNTWQAISPNGSSNFTVRSLQASSPQEWVYLHYEVRKSDTKQLLDPGELVYTTYTKLRVLPILESVSSREAYVGDLVPMVIGVRGGHLSKEEEREIDGKVWRQWPTQVTFRRLTGSLTLAAERDSLPADNLSQTTLTARFTDELGQPAPGIYLTFTASGGFLRAENGDWVDSLTRPTFQDGTASVAYKTDDQAGLSTVTVVSGGGRSASFVIIKTPLLSSPYGLVLKSDSSELILDPQSQPSLTLTAYYLTQSVPQSGREIFFVISGEGAVGTVTPSSGKTSEADDDTLPQLIASYQPDSKTSPQVISLVAYSFDNENFVAARLYLTLKEKEGESFLTVPDSEIEITSWDSDRQQELRFTLASAQTDQLLAGLYRVFISSSGSYGRSDYYAWSWGELLTFDFNLLPKDAFRKKIISLEPDFGYQGDSDLKVTVIGGRDTVFGDESVVTFTPVPSPYQSDFPGEVVAEVVEGSSQRINSLSRMEILLDISLDALPGFWNIKVTSPDRSQTYEMDGDEDFEVLPKGNAEYLMKLKAEPNVLVAGSGSTSTITARLFRYDDQLHSLAVVANTLIEFSRSGDDGRFIDGSQKYTDGNGEATATYKVGEDSTSQIITITATAKDDEGRSLVSQSVDIQKLSGDEVAIDLTVNFSLEARNYGQVWVMIKRAGDSGATLDQVTALPPEGLNHQLTWDDLYLRQKSTYTVWVKELHHLARRGNFSTGDSGEEISVTLPPMPIGDIGGTPPPGWQSNSNFLDNTINTADFTVLLGQWGWGNGTADFNGDGKVNSLDFVFILKNWGSGEGQP